MADINPDAHVVGERSGPNIGGIRSDRHGGAQMAQGATDNGNALSIDRRIFTRNDPADIARSLKEAAERSRKRRTTPFRSAMSVLTFYINRAGADLDAKQRKVLEAAKGELRKAFGKV